MFSFFLLSAVQIMNAQSSTIKGTIKDDTGQPLPGATILVTDSTQGTTTDFDGNYELTILSSTESLSISFLGFKTQIVPYTGQSVINATLEVDRSTLDEVVVVGYGTQKAKDVTGAISKIKSDVLEKTPNSTIEQALSGRISGVNTIASDGTPGGGVRIRIRGGTSINANNEPLYVIDGQPVEVDYSVSDGPSAISGPSSSPLANIDPSSIESIEVLKDASAAAIYGARGANGVVLITTKSGKTGKTELVLDTYTSISTVPTNRYVGLMNTSQYGTYIINQQLYKNGIENPDLTFPDPNDPNGSYTPEQEQARYDALPSSDWQELMYNSGVVNNYTLSASGGNEKNLFAIRGSYYKNEGAIVNSFFKRYNFNVNLTNKISDKLTVKTVLSPSYSLKQGPITGGDFNQKKMGIVIKSLSKRTDRESGEVYDDGDTDNGVWVDPVTEAKAAKSLTNTSNFNGNILVSYKFLKSLTGSVRLGTNITDGKTKSYFTKEFGRGHQENGVGTRYHYQNISWNNQIMLTYRNSFGKNNSHRLTALAAFTQSYSSKETEYLYVRDFAVESLGYYALQNGIDPATPQTYTHETYLKSYLGRVNYGIANRYNFTFSMRADGSSRFGSDNKWGYFPAAGFSWNVDRENFMDNANGVSNLKLRMSYGQTGNQGIPAYGSFAILGNSNYVLNGGTVAGYAPTELPNPELKWEFTDQFDVGIDAGFFDNRINFTVDAYYKRTEDLLLRIPIPISSGHDDRLTNIGNVENKGLEVALNTVNIDGKFKWYTDFVFAKNENKVLDLGGSQEKLFTDQFTNGKFTGIIRVGESLGNWYGYETGGVFSYEDFDENGDLIDTSYGAPAWVNPDRKAKLGDVKYVDQNADGTITSDDRKIIARTQPKHFGSVNNTFVIGGFEMGVYFTYKYGFDVINGNKHRLIATGFSNSNKTIDLVDAWTPYNTETNIPRADYSDKDFTDRYVEDGSFIRLQSINLSYNLPSEVTHKIGLNSLKIYSNVENLYIWTKYSGYDPEVGIATGQRAITSQNLDYGAYPRTMNVTLGVRIGF